MTFGQLSGGAKFITSDMVTASGAACVMMKRDPVEVVNEKRERPATAVLLIDGMGVYIPDTQLVTRLA